MRRHRRRQASPGVAAVLDAGFDPEWGARTLERAFEKLVVAPLAAALDDHPAGPLKVAWNGDLVVEAGA